MPVSIATATIAAVTVQALRVDGKEMTPAVFGQLPEHPAYNDDGSLPDLEWWGLVRYEIKDGSLWAVASKAGSLYRCPVYSREAALKSAKAKLDRESQQAADLEQKEAAFAQWQTDFAEWEKKRLAWQSECDAVRRAAKEAERTCPIPEPVYLETPNQDYWNAVRARNEWFVARVPIFPELPVPESPPKRPNYTAEDKKRSARSRNDAEKKLAIEQRAAESYQALMDLPQMFIAI